MGREYPSQVLEQGYPGVRKGVPPRPWPGPGQGYPLLRDSTGHGQDTQRMVRLLNIFSDIKLFDSSEWRTSD